LRGPGEAVGIGASVDLGGDRESVKVDDGDVIVWSAGDEGAGTVGLHLDAGCAVAHGKCVLLRCECGVDDHCVGAAELETKTSLPSGVNLRRLALRTLASRVCTTSFLAMLMMEMVPSWEIGGPQFPAVWGDVESFVSIANFDDGLIPFRRGRKGRAPCSTNAPAAAGERLAADQKAFWE